MIRYLNVQDSPVETKLTQTNMVQPNQSFSHIAVPTVVPQSFPISQDIQPPQQILPQYHIPTLNGLRMVYPQSMGSTAITNNLLGMVSPSQIYHQQITAQASAAVPQPLELTNNNIFNKSYVYTTNIPMDTSCSNITAPNTPYSSVSNQNQNRLARVLPPPNTLRLNSFYTSRSKTNSVGTSRNSSNSILSGRSDSTLLTNQNLMLSKTSITSQGSVDSVSDVPTLTPEANYNNNQAYTTSRIPSNPIPVMLAAPVSLSSVPAPTVTSSTSSPVAMLIKNKNEEENPRRHSVTLAGLTNNEINNSKLLDHQTIIKNNSHPDLPTLANTSSNCNSNIKITKPGKLGERYNNKGQLIGKSGKLLRDTKRAAQNRCAQKAFRLRREKYLKDLEEKAEKFDKLMEENERLKKTVELLKQDKKNKLEQIA
ncbi:hypothetical protein C6P44_005078 [Monosporozyma unispora]|nr:hypothetical protein C6P44_005078 [Kazachstania unispora]